jgi:hypothetical protein
MDAASIAPAANAQAAKLIFLDDAGKALLLVLERTLPAAGLPPI